MLRPASLLAAALLLAPLQAWSMDIRVDGASVILSGPVEGFECDALSKILAENRITTVVLTNSGGGNADAGYCVGGVIRSHGLATVIRGRCASSCSRMWLGGAERSLEGSGSRVGLHGNYSSTGGLDRNAPQKLRNWLVEHAPSIDKRLMEKWINLPTNKWMMYFYNDKAELCNAGACDPLPGRNVFNAGLAPK